MSAAGDEARGIVRAGLKDVRDYLDMAGLVVAKPLPWCPAKVAGGKVCIRSPHPDNEHHVYQPKKRRDG